MNLYLLWMSGHSFELFGQGERSVLAIYCKQLHAAGPFFHILPLADVIWAECKMHCGQIGIFICKFLRYIL